LVSIPANKAVTTPATNPRGVKYGLIDIAIVPPKNAERAPSFGPMIIPIIGARIVAATMALLKKPITGERGKKERTTYRAVKQIIKARSFVTILLLADIFVILPYASGNLIIYHIAYKK
jgi:hypothetical protein